MRIFHRILILCGLIGSLSPIAGAESSPFETEGNETRIERTSVVGGDQTVNQVFESENGSRVPQEAAAPAEDPPSKFEPTGRLKPHARRKTSSSSTGRTSSSGPVGQWMTTLLGLAVVLGLIFSFAYAFRKHIPLANKVLPPDVIEVLGRRFIDQKNCVQLIRCGTRILIVAHSPTHGLQTLGEISDPVEVDSLAGRCKQADASSMTSRFEELVASQFRTAREKTPTDTGPSLEAESHRAGLRTPRASQGGASPREAFHA